MSNYRIVKVKGYNCIYKAQKKGLIFWHDISHETSFDMAESHIKWELDMEKAKKANPKNVVVKTFEVN